MSKSHDFHAASDPFIYLFRPFSTLFSPQRDLALDCEKLSDGPLGRSHKTHLISCRKTVQRGALEFKRPDQLLDLNVALQYSA